MVRRARRDLDAIWTPPLVYQHGFFSEVTRQALTLPWSGWPWRRRRSDSNSERERSVGTCHVVYARNQFHVSSSLIQSCRLCSRTRPRKTCCPPRHTLTFSLLIVGKYISAQSCRKALKDDSGVLNMSPGIGRSVSRPSPDTSRTPSSTLLPFKSSGFMRTMILFGSASRNPYLSQNCSTGA